MILRDNTEIQGLLEPHSNSYLAGSTDRSVIGLAFEQTYKNSVTGWVADKLSERYDALMGYQQDLVSVEEAKEKWGIINKEPETLSKVRHKARLNSFNRYSDLSQKIAGESDGTAYNWVSTLGGVLAGSFFDPLLLVGSLGVGNGVKAIGTTIKPIAKALYSSNPIVKHASRVGLFGGSDATYNVTTGKIIDKQRGREYTAGDYSFDIAFGAIVGTFVGSRMLRAAKVNIGGKVVATDKLKEVPFLSKSTDEGKVVKEFKDVKIDKDFVSEVDMSSADVYSAKAVDFYDQMRSSDLHLKVSEPEKNILTFIKANEINGAVNSEYMDTFLGMQDNITNIIKKTYGFKPTDVQSAKAFSATIENDIASVIATMSKNTGIPKTLEAMEPALAPMYKNLTEKKNIFSGEALAVGNKEISYDSAKMLTPEGISSNVSSGLAAIDKVRPFQKPTDVKPLSGSVVKEEVVSPVVEALRADVAYNKGYKESVSILRDRVKVLDDSTVDKFVNGLTMDIERMPRDAHRTIAVSDTIDAIFSSPSVSSRKKIVLAAKYYNAFSDSISMGELYTKFIASVDKIQKGDK